MDWDDVQQAKLTEEIGLKQPVEYTEEEKWTIATHEAGHAVVAHLVGVDRKLEVLSIIKRTDTLGLLAHSDTEERFTRRRSELMAMVQIAFGGMTAEELFFGEAGTGPSSDLAHATTIAAQMVGSFGMAGSLVSFEAVENGPISQGIVAKVLVNEETARGRTPARSGEGRHTRAARREPAPREGAARRVARARGAHRRRDHRRVARGRGATSSKALPPRSAHRGRYRAVMSAQRDGRDGLDTRVVVVSDADGKRGADIARALAGLDAAIVLAGADRCAGLAGIRARSHRPRFAALVDDVATDRGRAALVEM